MLELSRRAFVQATGASLIAAPFARLLSPGRAHAQSAGTAKRIIFWFSPNGTVHRHWRPSGEGASFDFPAGSVLEPLAAHKSRLLVLDGLNFEHVRGGSHEGGMEHMLTGGGAASVDQYIAAQLGAGTPFPSIELSVQTSAWGASVQTRMAYNDAHEFVHPEDDPALAFKRLFAGVSSGSSDGPETNDPVLAGRRSVLDLVKGELQGLQRRLGHEERPKLEAHLDSLRRLEQRVQGGGRGAAGCMAPEAPSSLDKDANDNFPVVGELQMDLLTAAAACDLSRVLSLQWSHTVSPTILSWAGAGEGHHELSHKDDSNEAGVQEFIGTERWFAEQFAAFLDRLAATQEPDGSGSLLDTSTVIWCKELGDGRLHDFKSVPFVIAGAGNGFFQPGRYLDFGGQPHQKLLVSLCHSMGLSNTSFGADQVSGSLTELQA